MADKEVKPVAPVAPESPRETLTRAFAAEDARVGQSGTDTSGGSPAVEAAGGEEGKPAAAPQPKAGEQGGSVRVRGADGKFKPGEGDEQPEPDEEPVVEEPAPEGGEPAPDDEEPAPEGGKPVVQAKPGDKAPQGWKPDERDAWAKGDVVGIKKGAMRREKEIAATLKETSAARQGWDTIRQIVGPFEAMIRAEGSDPFRAIHSLLSTSTALRTAPAPRKAEMIASMVKQFLGIDDNGLTLLDQELAKLRGGGGGEGAQPKEFRDPRFDQFMQALEQGKSKKQQDALARETENWNKFKESHEFAEDLSESIADLIEIASKRGVDLSYEDAYKRAAMMDDSVRPLYEQRAAAARAAKPGGLDAAKAAASSVRGSSARMPAKDKAPTTVAEALNKSFDLHEKRASGQ